MWASGVVAVAVAVLGGLVGVGEFGEGVVDSVLVWEGEVGAVWPIRRWLGALDWLVLGWGAMGAGVTAVEAEMAAGDGVRGVEAEMVVEADAGVGAGVETVARVGVVVRVRMAAGVDLGAGAEAGTGGWA